MPGQSLRDKRRRAGYIRPVIARTSFLFLLTGLLSHSLLRADALPSRDPGVVVPLLLATPGENLRGVERILGRPDSSFVNGFTIYVFHLDDATSVYAASPDHRRIFSLRRSAPGDIAVTLYEPLARYRTRPTPTSAPF